MFDNASMMLGIGENRLQIVFGWKIMKVKLPSGKVLHVSTSPTNNKSEDDAQWKSSQEKPGVTINVYGGNNSIAPNASQVVQNIQNAEK